MIQKTMIVLAGIVLGFLTLAFIPIYPTDLRPARAKQSQKTQPVAQIPKIGTSNHEFPASAVVPENAERLDMPQTMRAKIESDCESCNRMVVAVVRVPGRDIWDGEIRDDNGVHSLSIIRSGGRTGSWRFITRNICTDGLAASEKSAEIYPTFEPFHLAFSKSLIVTGPCTGKRLSIDITE